MKKGFLGLIILFLILEPSLVLAGKVYIVNSRDWKDVYSGMQYGYLGGTDTRFLVSEKHSTIIFGDITKSNEIEILSSKKSPFVFGYESTARGMGYDVNETVFTTLSIELAKKLAWINNYIVLDDSYGYNAIAVAPYAMASRSYVLFTDKTNIDETMGFLDNKQNLTNILIYGNVDRIVRERLDKFHPEIVNKDGDRFANNVEIVKKYKQLPEHDKKQVFLTNGEFIEADLMSGEYPTLFIGANNVPDKIKEYIMGSNIEVGVLIGNELVGTATTVRRQTGISTFVKFARSARQASGPIAQVEGLDIFRLPTYTLSINIDSARYNAVNNQLEITMKNMAELATYYKGTYTITIGDQQQIVGDNETIFLDGNDIKTVVYDLDPLVGDSPINLKAYVIFGESKESLERALEQSLVVERVEVIDDTSVTIKKVTYQKDKKRFVIQLENTGNIDTYVKTELVDLLILDERKSFASQITIKIPAKKFGNSIINAEMTDDDLQKNGKIKVRAYYGQRENALAKILEGEFDLAISAFDILIYLPLVVIIILIILLILAKKKKKRHNTE